MQPERFYQELAQGAEWIRALVSGVSPQEARLRPAPEAWSLLEVVCHLYDEEREDFRAHLDLVLHPLSGGAPRVWQPIDPQGWVVARQYNERNLNEAMAAFLTERNRSLAWLKGLPAPNWEAVYQLPFGPLRAGDILAAWVAHDHLHARQLVELRYHRLLRLAEPYAVRYAGEW